MTIVFDSSALLALLRGEQGGGAVRVVLSDPDSACHIHALNLCEVFYVMCREYGERAARERLEEMLEAGLSVHEDLDTAFWQDAARIKADYRRVSLADCGGVALTRRLGATFFTTDHHELDPLAAAGVCQVRFIR